MDKFTLTITLGNEGMEDEAGIARALEVVREQVLQGRQDSPIIDVNGNRVGEWEII